MASDDYAIQRVKSIGSHGIGPGVQEYNNLVSVSAKLNL